MTDTHDRAPLDTPVECGCDDDLDAIARSTVRGLAPGDLDALVGAAVPAAEAAYEAALVAGLCCDGAREAFVDTVTTEARRLLAAVPTQPRY